MRNQIILDSNIGLEALSEARQFNDFPHPIRRAWFKRVAASSKRGESDCHRLCLFRLAINKVQRDCANATTAAETKPAMNDAIILASSRNKFASVASRRLLELSGTDHVRATYRRSPADRRLSLSPR
jgi:hypothetical protein